MTRLARAHRNPRIRAVAGTLANQLIDKGIRGENGVKVYFKVACRVYLEIYNHARRDDSPDVRRNAASIAGAAMKRGVMPKGISSFFQDVRAAIVRIRTELDQESDATVRNVGGTIISAAANQPVRGGAAGFKMYGGFREGYLTVRRLAEGDGNPLVSEAATLLAQAAISRNVKGETRAHVFFEEAKKAILRAHEMVIANPDPVVRAEAGYFANIVAHRGVRGEAAAEKRVERLLKMRRQLSELIAADPDSEIRTNAPVLLRQMLKVLGGREEGQSSQTTVIDEYGQLKGVYLHMYRLASHSKEPLIQAIAETLASNTLEVRYESLQSVDAAFQAMKGRYLKMYRLAKSDENDAIRSRAGTFATVVLRQDLSLQEVSTLFQDIKRAMVTASQGVAANGDPLVHHLQAGIEMAIVRHQVRGEEGAKLFLFNLRGAIAGARQALELQPHDMPADPQLPLFRHLVLDGIQGIAAGHSYATRWSR